MYPTEAFIIISRKQDKLTKALGCMDPETENTQHLRLFEIEEEAENVLQSLQDPQFWEVKKVIVTSLSWINWGK